MRTFLDSCASRGLSPRRSGVARQGGTIKESIPPSLGWSLGLGLALVLFATGFAAAAERTILGTTFTVKNPTGTNERRSIVGIAKETGSPNLFAGNPTVGGVAGGATLQISVDGDTPSLQTFPLPQGVDASGRSFWTRSTRSRCASASIRRWRG